MTNPKAYAVGDTLTDDEAQALARLLRVASSDTGQSRIVADFLLAWWNAESCGGFAPTGMWGLDTALVADIQTVFGLIGRRAIYPDTLGLDEEFEGLIAKWRPALAPPRRV